MQLWNSADRGRSMMQRLALILFLATSATGCSQRNGEVTVYHVYCDNSVPVESCWSIPRQPLTAAPTTYRVSAERQSVISWVKGGWGLRALENCVVRDKKHWTCEYLDGSLDVFMHQGELTERFTGEYRDHNEDPLVTHRLQVSWSKYQMLRLREFFSTL